MGRDLEHAVAAGVDDRLAGLDVLRPELLDDRGAARRVVAEPPETRLARERLHDVGRKPVRVRREGTLEHHPDHLPVTRGRILASRALRILPPGSGRCIRGRHAEDSGDVAQPHRAQVGHRQAPGRGGGVRQACCCPRPRTSAASGNSPAPTLSSTSTIARGERVTSDHHPVHFFEARRTCCDPGERILAHRRHAHLHGSLPQHVSWRVASCRGRRSSRRSPSTSNTPILPMYPVLWQVLHPTAPYVTTVGAPSRVKPAATSASIEVSFTSLHDGHRTRTSRCATTPSNADDVM